MPVISLDFPLPPFLPLPASDAPPPAPPIILAPTVPAAEDEALPPKPCPEVPAAPALPLPPPPPEPPVAPGSSIFPPPPPPVAVMPLKALLPPFPLVVLLGCPPAPTVTV